MKQQYRFHAQLKKALLTVMFQACVHFTQTCRKMVFVLQADQVTVKIPADFQLEEDLPTVMSQLSTFIYKHGEERSKARAMLCCIFFEAIHNNFYTVS